jgi:hypothetical protein
VFGVRVSKIQAGTVHIDAAVARDDEDPRVQWYHGDFRQAQETMEHTVDVSDNHPFLARGPKLRETVWLTWFQKEMKDSQKTRTGSRVDS